MSTNRVDPLTKALVGALVPSTSCPYDEQEQAFKTSCKDVAERLRIQHPDAANQMIDILEGLKYGM